MEITIKVNGLDVQVTGAPEETAALPTALRERQSAPAGGEPKASEWRSYGDYLEIRLRGPDLERFREVASENNMKARDIALILTGLRIKPGLTLDDLPAPGPRPGERR